jgi:hypothetical protein
MFFYCARSLAAKVHFFFPSLFDLDKKEGGAAANMEPPRLDFPDTGTFLLHNAFVPECCLLQEEEEEEEEDEVEIALRSAHSRIKDLYSKLYQGRTGEKPLMTAPDFALLKTRLHEVASDVTPQVAEKKITAVLRHAMSGDYRDFQANLPPLQTILSKYHWNRIVSGLALGAKR